MDRFSAEIFVNDGEHVMTATIYTDLEADGIFLLCRWQSGDGCYKVRAEVLRIASRYEEDIK